MEDLKHAVNVGEVPSPDEYAREYRGENHLKDELLVAGQPRVPAFRYLDRVVYEPEGSEGEEQQHKREIPDVDVEIDENDHEDE